MSTQPLRLGIIAITMPAFPALGHLPKPSTATVNCCATTAEFMADQFSPKELSNGFTLDLLTATMP
jgi:hypothetical protein